MRFLSFSSIPVAALIVAAVCPCPLLAQDAASGQPASASQVPAPSASAPNPTAETPRNVPSPSTAAPYGEITGTVKSGNIPLPGVTVAAANSLTGKKYVTSTDVDGSYKIQLMGRGRYVVRAELTAFAPVTQEIVINDQNRAGKAELSMELLSRAQKEAQQQQGQQMAQALAGAGRGGMQQLSLTNSGDVSGSGQATLDASALAGAGLPNAGLAAEGNTESVAISGAQGRAEENMFDPGEMQDRIAELRDQLRLQGGGSGTVTLNGATANIQILGGGFGGGGFGGGPMTFIMGGPGFGGGGGRGGRGGRGFNVNKPHGSIFYNYGGSVLDAAPYSLNGEPVQKASYNQSRFGISMGAPLNIPHIYKGGNKTFVFGNYTGSRGSTAYDQFSNVPTLAERSGDFSALLNSPNPIQLFDPLTHAPILNNQITNINPAAAQLLSFIPQPNLPGTVRNFHFVSSTPSDMDTAFLRFNHRFGSDPGGMFGFGPRAQIPRHQREQSQDGNKEKEKTHWSQSINGGFVYNNVRSTVLNPFPGLGGRQGVHNYNVNFGHSAVKGMFLNSLHFSYSRNNIQTTNNFTRVNNIEGQLGISGVSQAPADFGLPILNLAPLFNLQDLTPQFRTNQNYSLGDSMSLAHGKHSWTWGGDFRHQLADVRNSANARGTFIFTGAATANPTGSFAAQQPFADFLLGQAEQTSIQFGAADYHFRANSFDFFVQDNWRAGKNLTLNLGLRYELVNPMIESNNQLANLDVARANRPDYGPEISWWLDQS